MFPARLCGGVPVRYDADPMQILADAKQVSEVVQRLTDEAAAAMARSPGPWAVVGIKSRGDVLAHRITAKLTPKYSGSIDIALYRDDLSGSGARHIVRTTDINFPMDGTNVLLVDDVLMSGRSIRAALQSIMDFGRPGRVKLMVLVDRGGRELPIAPDFVGLRVNADASDQVEVRLKPTDDSDRIALTPRKASEAGA
jgi:pyrimidine operon attenuation protein/uracil phosphoribosyltransferase